MLVHADADSQSVTRVRRRAGILAPHVLVPPVAVAPGRPGRASQQRNRLAV